MDPRTAFRAVYIDFEADPLPSRSSKGRYHVGPVRITYLASSADTAWKEVVARWAADPVAFRMVEVEVTVSDSKAYSKPWTIKLNQVLQFDTDLLDYICLENEKDLTHFVVK